jgi:hypothetical protein
VFLGGFRVLLGSWWAARALAIHSKQLQQVGGCARGAGPNLGQGREALLGVVACGLCGAVGRGVGEEVAALGLAGRAACCNLALGSYASMQYEQLAAAGGLAAGPSCAFALGHRVRFNHHLRVSHHSHLAALLTHFCSACCHTQVT